MRVTATNVKARKSLTRGLAPSTILKGWKSLSPGLRGTSYPGVKHHTSTTLKGLHQLRTAVASEPFSRITPILLGWFTRHARDLPWRRTHDPYAIWVSEIMLQQTQVKTVLPFYHRWMRALPNIKSLANARSQRIHKLWEGLGYYTRVRNMQKAAKTILSRHGAKFPDKFDDVLALPGIGRYTAGAICSIAFNQPTPILDGNVIRVLTRLFGISGDPRERMVNQRLWALSEQFVLAAARLEALPVKKQAFTLDASPQLTHDGARNTKHASPLCSQLNQSLMELGALMCTPRQPKCGNCPLVKFCVAHQQCRIDQLPNLRARPSATRQRFAAFVAQKRRHFLVRQRPAGVRNALLWEFPNVEITPHDSDLKQAARKSLGTSLATFDPLCTIRYSITRYRITLEVFLVTGTDAANCSRSAGTWLNRRQLLRLPFTSAHRQILNHLGVRK